MVKDLTEFFEPPYPAPPLDPRFIRNANSLTGVIPPEWADQPAFSLVAKVGGLEAELASELVNFGAFWVKSRPQVDPAWPLKPGLIFRVNWPRYGPIRFYEADSQRIVYEDQDLLVYNKESAIPTQIVPYDRFNNAQEALKRLTGTDLKLPHRLDAGTSGLLMSSKTPAGALGLGRAFKDGLVSKRYIALTSGPPPTFSQKIVTATIARAGQRFVARANGPGKAAKTILTVLKANEDRVLWLAKLETGRTHQIRLHLSFIGYPVLGDNFYGGIVHERLMLRAISLRLKHPLTGEPLSFGPTEEELSDLVQD
ncbi:MAG: RluA family pseudouridine synthase [Deltaproteobacteria bacterium]|nr:RluA family pseudouridine synthase [Deltaproteobacteria bacterium]